MEYVPGLVGVAAIFVAYAFGYAEGARHAKAVAKIGAADAAEETRKTLRAAQGV